MYSTDRGAHVEAPSKVEAFFSQYPKRTFRKGQVLLLNGDDLDHVHYLLGGRVKSYDVSYRGDEIVINRFRPGAFFPMALALNPEPSQYIYEAETNIEVYSAPVADVVKLLQDNPDVTYDLLRRVYRGLDGILGRMVQLMGSSARSRLAYELTVEARRFGKRLGEGKILLDTHEHSIGEQAGLSRETVSREVHKLKKEGLIDMSPAGIIIRDLKALEQLIKV
jgi:CRP/FNR family transcriptional regulator